MRLRSAKSGVRDGVVFNPFLTWGSFEDGRCGAREELYFRIIEVTFQYNEHFRIIEVTFQDYRNDFSVKYFSGL